LIVLPFWFALVLGPLRRFIVIVEGEDDALQFGPTCGSDSFHYGYARLGQAIKEHIIPFFIGNSRTATPRPAVMLAKLHEYHLARTASRYRAGSDHAGG
jgi:hypothetical protein